MSCKSRYILHTSSEAGVMYVEAGIMHVEAGVMHVEAGDAYRFIPFKVHLLSVQHDCNTKSSAFLYRAFYTEEVKNLMW